MNIDVFDKYNKEIQKECEAKLDYVTTKAEYISLINDARKHFETTSIQGSPINDVIQTQIEESGIHEVLNNALMVCDMYLPYSLIDLMQKKIGFEGIKKMIDDKSKPEADRASLINSLIGIENEDLYKYLIDIIVTSDSELLKEEAADVLSLMDKNKVNLNILESFDKNGVNNELLSVLVAVYKDTDESDSIYQLLRKHFILSDNKSMIANIMADLNDGRAVVFLRGYLSKNLNDIAKSEIFDICSAISRLGGYTEDFIKFNNQTH